MKSNTRIFRQLPPGIGFQSLNHLFLRVSFHGSRVTGARSPRVEAHPAWSINSAGELSRMPFDCAVLLAPVSGDKLCGEALDEHALYDDFRKLASSPSRPDWGRHLDRAMALSGASRDLRAWIWLTRASLCADGVPGLAAGLRLMADGLDRYWEELPPQHADEAGPERALHAAAVGADGARRHELPVQPGPAPGAWPQSRGSAGRPRSHGGEGGAGRGHPRGDRRCARGDRRDGSALRRTLRPGPRPATRLRGRPRQAQGHRARNSATRLAAAGGMADRRLRRASRPPLRR